MLNSEVDTEVKSILGRADVVIKTKTDIFVLELKVDDTVENALKQIDEKGYAIQYSPLPFSPEAYQASSRLREPQGGVTCQHDQGVTIVL